MRSNDGARCVTRETTGTNEPMKMERHGGWGGVDARLGERTADGGDVVEGRGGDAGGRGAKGRHEGGRAER